MSGPSRRPIQEHEIPYLEACGSEIRRLRLAAGLSLREAALGAELSAVGFGDIERAQRRTRRSTLYRIARSLLDFDDDEASLLADRLAGLAGPALAPESEFADRIARRRARRMRRVLDAEDRRLEARNVDWQAALEEARREMEEGGPDDG